MKILTKLKYPIFPHESSNFAPRALQIFILAIKVQNQKYVDEYFLFCSYSFIIMPTIITANLGPIDNSPPPLPASDICLNLAYFKKNTDGPFKAFSFFNFVKKLCMYRKRYWATL